MAFEVENRLRDALAALARPQVDRLTYIDFRLFFLGELRRSDVIERFQTGPAGATRDVAMYRQLVPGNLDFDVGTKLYRASRSFGPLFEHPVHRALIALSQGFGDVARDNPAPLVKCEFPGRLSQPNVEVVAAVTRALHGRKPLRISYHSNTSGISEREVVPLGLVDTGVRWHVRAFDRRTKTFRDFVLTRITSPVVLYDGVTTLDETAEHDLQWSRVVELELVPHPSIERPEVVELDYGMKDGALRVQVRAANVGYMLRLWSVDCSRDHRLSGPEFALWLKDPMVLYGADSAKLAPGYKP